MGISGGVISRQPDNLNPLQNTSFKFVIEKIPTTQWFIQTANLPGLALGSVEQFNMFVKIPHSGNIVYDDFSMQFLVDEDLSAWSEVHNWVKKTTNAKNFDEFDISEIYSDASLIIVSNKLNATISVDFKDLFPVALSGLDFDISSDNSNPMTATVNFAYSYYEINVVT